MKEIVVFGGRGVFGKQIVSRLEQSGLRVAVAGRTGPHHADATSRKSCLELLQRLEAPIAVNCSGPFSLDHLALVEACAQTGCHYVDISENRSYVARLRALSSSWKAAGIAVIPGCSSLPAISVALAELAQATGARNARVTLFVGNRNPKGGAALEAALSQAGKTILCPGKEIVSFAEAHWVTLPKPFGRRKVVNFESPDYDLFPELFGIENIVVKVGFELPFSSVLLPRIAFLGGTAILRLARPLQWLGHSGGVVMVELWNEEETLRRQISLHSHANGQQMAALPCALVVEKLSKMTAPPKGTFTAVELLTAPVLIQSLQAQGFELSTRPDYTKSTL